MAQSVPSAGLIPCIVALPPGWEMTDAETSTGTATLHFSNDAHDLDAVVRLEEECDLSSSTAIATDRPGTSMYVSNDASGYQLAYELQGACISFVFETAEFGLSVEGRGLPTAIDFLSRERLRELSNREL